MCVCQNSVTTKFKGIQSTHLQVNIKTMLPLWTWRPWRQGSADVQLPCFKSLNAEGWYLFKQNKQTNKKRSLSYYTCKQGACLVHMTKIIPQKVVNRLDILDLWYSLCSRIMDFEHPTSSSLLTLNTRMSLTGLWDPSSPIHAFDSIIISADITTVVGLITDNKTHHSGGSYYWQ